MVKDTIHGSYGYGILNRLKRLSFIHTSTWKRRSTLETLRIFCEKMGVNKNHQLRVLLGISVNLGWEVRWVCSNFPYK